MKIKDCLLFGIFFVSIFGSYADLTNKIIEADSAVTISISIPEHGNQRSLENRGTDPHFHVIISNVSDQPQRIWREWCSWGYYALSFEFTDQTGKTWIAKKKPKTWSKNYPDWWTIAPHENLVIDVYFANEDIWDEFPHPSDTTGKKFRMRAVFEIKSDDRSSKYSIWTGRIVSKADEYMFHN